MNKKNLLFLSLQLSLVFLSVGAVADEMTKAGIFQSSALLLAFFYGPPELHDKVPRSHGGCCSKQSSAGIYSEYLSGSPSTQDELFQPPGERENNRDDGYDDGDGNNRRRNGDAGYFSDPEEIEELLIKLREALVRYQNSSEEIQAAIRKELVQVFPRIADRIPSLIAYQGFPILYYLDFHPVSLWENMMVRLLAQDTDLKGFVMVFHEEGVTRFINVIDRHALMEDTALKKATGLKRKRFNKLDQSCSEPAGDECHAAPGNLLPVNSLSDHFRENEDRNPDSSEGITFFAGAHSNSSPDLTPISDDQPSTSTSTKRAGGDRNRPKSMSDSLGEIYDTARSQYLDVLNKMFAADAKTFEQNVPIRHVKTRKSLFRGKGSTIYDQDNKNSSEPAPDPYWEESF